MGDPIRALLSLGFSCREGKQSLPLSKPQVSATVNHEILPLLDS